MPYCNKCKKVLKDINFYTYRDGEKTELCKKCLTMHVDPYEPDTFLWLLEKMDVPYLPAEWNVLRDRAAEKDPDSVSGTAIFGKYLGKMKLNQWREYHWSDTERLQKEKEEEKEKYLAEHNVTEIDKKELRKQYLQGEITESQYKTLLPPEEVPKPHKKDKEAEGKQVFADNSFLDDVESPAAQLTLDDKIYLAMKWGRDYFPEQWIEMEKTYNDMINSFDIQDADTKNTLVLICKTLLKMNEAINIGDLDGFQKLSRVYDSLRKSSKFTAAQNKEEKGDFVDCVGLIVSYCEKEGGKIPRFDISVPRDIVDQDIQDMKDYTRSLIYEDRALAQQVETYIKKREAADRQKKDLQEAKENGLDVVELTDEDITEHFSVIKKDIQADIKLIQGDGN